MMEGQRPQPGKGEALDGYCAAVERCPRLVCGAPLALQRGAFGAG